MKLLELECKNIRGIKDIKITPEGNNVVVFGPNGTGKSAIVDSIDFLLTGQISRLAGEGADCLSLKGHGCHVDSREALANAIVTAKIEVDGNVVELQRSINAPSKLDIKPKKQEASVKSYIELAAIGQPVLSRREILKYITSKAGDRAKAIQSLLNLTNIEKIRENLVSIKNDANSTLKIQNSSLETAKNEIKILLSLPVFSEENTLAKVNELRGVLGGQTIEKLSKESFKDKLTPYLLGTNKDLLSKEQIENSISTITKYIHEGSITGAKETELKKLLDDIGKDKKLRQYSVYKKLFEAGLSLADESNTCPLCGRKWENGDLKQYLEQVKKNNDIAEGNQSKIDELSTTLKNKIDILKNTIDNLLKAHKQFNLPEVNKQQLEKQLKLFDSWSTAMLNPLEAIEQDKYPLSPFLELLDVGFVQDSIIVSLTSKLKDCGEQFSKEQIDWDTLTKLEDKWVTYQQVLSNSQNSKLYSDRAEALLTNFETSRNTVLKNIYGAIKDSLDNYYKAIHSIDEVGFVSKFEHEGAGLNLEVDFYGRGMFPPHALHSEGHQDSMGLCLFLALNEYLTRNTIKIIVLDDVVMSIDSNHRRAICGLLKQYFSDRQFIITTHDSVWAKELQAENIVTKKNMIHFMNWHVSTGPIHEFDKNSWDKIQEDLQKNDISAAAQKLRFGCECFFEDTCNLLGGKVTYKSNHRWEFGDYFPSAISILKDHINKSKQHYKSVQDTAKLQEVTAFEAKADTAIKKFNVENWAVNPNIHFNRWCDMSKQDFEPVVESCKQLFSLFECDKCHNLISFTLDRSDNGKSFVKCGCDNIFWYV